MKACMFSSGVPQSIQAVLIMKPLPGAIISIIFSQFFSMSAGV